MKKQRHLVFILIAMLFLTTCGTTTKPAPITIDGRQDPPGKLIWSDEFNDSSGSIPDQDMWTPNYGGNGWGNKQMEYDTNNKNVYQDGQGNLVIEADKSNPEGLHCWYGTCQYTSARISTAKHFSFIYGRIESRIKIPIEQGIWPAFWLLGSNCSTVKWPACGEFDAMEDNGKDLSTIYGSAHSPQGHFTRPGKPDSGTFADGFHAFAVRWDPNHIYFSVDGNTYAILKKASFTNQQDWVFNHPFDIVLNVAVGGVWPGNPDAASTFPQKMYVDYVRLYSI